MIKKKVLFICNHNSARSQIAEGLVNHFFKETWEAKSAGIVSTEVNPFAIKAMKQIGIDISGHTSKTIDTFKDENFDLVVTMCDSEKGICPFFPGKSNIYISFADPSTFEGNDIEKLKVFYRTRDEIKEWLVSNLINYDKKK
ncbi:MAG: arsenate reductase ArsC [Candidatus Cloacimonetes bacterium]|nr:arsenate reductase ArsC [Candidatus Cloacimonadota bacterium]